MSHIFVSHATKDDDTVTRIHDALEKAGLDPWVDHIDGINPGDNWSGEIQDALNRCDCGLLVLSPESAVSLECEAEYRRVMTLKKRLYVVLIAPIKIEMFPWRLGTIQYVDLTSDFDAGLRKLIAAIQGKRELDPADEHVKRMRPVTGEIQASLLSVPIQGREDDLKQIAAYLDTGRPTQILGVGGLGKSRLAAELAFSYPAVDGAIWLRCDDVATADDFVYQMREHFELDLTSERAAVLKQFGSKKRLVVIDNAESVPDDDPRRAEFTRLVNQLAANKASVLLTSRLEWEDIEPPYHSYTPKPLTADAGTQVVLAMAETFQAPAVTHDPAAFAEAARQHAGLIEWAVRQTKKRELAIVLNELRSLQGKRLDDALDEIIHKSLRTMTAAEGPTPEAVLRRLAVCRGGFTYEAAQAICASYVDELEDALLTLQAWQFARFDPMTQRRSLDPLAEAVLTPDESAHKPHYDFYHALALQHHDRQEYYGLDVERDNLTAAYEWAIQGNGEDALWLVNACGDFLSNRGRFDQRMDWIERVVAVLETHEDKTLWANAQNSLGIIYQQYPTGSQRDNLRKAIAAFEAALEYSTPQAAPLNYAMTQNNLGNAYRDLAQIEDGAVNLHKAITAYEAALQYSTPQATPEHYAGTQNNLGIAYADLAEIEDGAVNLRKAITAYEAALEYFTPEVARLDYAMTQNNLGNAYTDLSEIEDRAGNLYKAITAYEAALEYYTPLAAPKEYAMMQNNLGEAYRYLAQVEDRLGNLHRAIAAYEVALEYYVPLAAPKEYAATQNNLGAAYWSLARVEDRLGNLHRAIAAYEVALKYRTPQDARLDYAMTQANLGRVHRDLGNIEGAIICWSEAERNFWQMDRVEDAEMVRRWIEDAEGKMSGG